jgi:hypothetical protein
MTNGNSASRALLDDLVHRPTETALVWAWPLSSVQAQAAEYHEYVVQCSIDIDIIPETPGLHVQICFSAVTTIRNKE